MNEFLKQIGLEVVDGKADLSTLSPPQYEDLVAFLQKNKEIVIGCVIGPDPKKNKGFVDLIEISLPQARLLTRMVEGRRPVGDFVIVLLGANGDISRCAQHYIHHIPKPLNKPIWVVGRKYLPILEQLYGDYFTPYPLDLPQNNPILATKIARKKWPMAKVGNIQQNGSDPDLVETKQYHSYQEYQIAKLEELFKA